MSIEFEDILVDACGRWNFGILEEFERKMKSKVAKIINYKIW